jgi:small subunit ribosomal protein S8
MSGVTDPISDMLTRIRNGGIAKMDSVNVPYSKLKAEIARILNEEGYVKSYEVNKNDGPGGMVKVYLKYSKNGECTISGLKRVSKPGLRVYAKKDEIPKVLGGLGVSLLSTSKGLLTDKDARKQQIGGEVICLIW